MWSDVFYVGQLSQNLKHFKIAFKSDLTTFSVILETIFINEQKLCRYSYSNTKKIKRVFNFCANAIGLSENVTKVSILSNFLQYGNEEQCVIKEQLNKTQYSGSIYRKSSNTDLFFWSLFDTLGIGTNRKLQRRRDCYGKAASFIFNCN